MVLCQLVDPLSLSTSITACLECSWSSPTLLIGRRCELVRLNWHHWIMSIWQSWIIIKMFWQLLIEERINVIVTVTSLVSWFSHYGITRVITNFFLCEQSWAELPRSERADNHHHTKTRPFYWMSCELHCELHCELYNLAIFEYLYVLSLYQE